MLKLNIEGSPEEIQHFMKDFKAQPQYQVSEDTQLSYNNRTESSLYAQLQYQPQPAKKEMVLTITTLSGKEIKLNLFDGKVIEMGNGMTYINGKIYDAFG